MTPSKNESLELYRNQAVRAAEDLGYSKETIDDIENGETESEIAKIMRVARLRKFG